MTKDASQPLFDGFLEEVLQDLGRRVDRVVELFCPVLVEDAISTEKLRRQSNDLDAVVVAAVVVAAVVVIAVSADADVLYDFCGSLFSDGLENNHDAHYDPNLTLRQYL